MGERDREARRGKATEEKEKVVLRSDGREKEGQVRDYTVNCKKEICGLLN